MANGIAYTILCQFTIDVGVAVLCSVSHSTTDLGFWILVMYEAFNVDHAYHEVC